jgi:hypothetical protein
MRFERKRGQNEKKHVLQLEKMFFLLLFFGWSFGFAFKNHL